MKRNRSIDTLPNTLRCAGVLAAVGVLAALQPVRRADGRGTRAGAVAARRSLLHGVPQRRRARGRLDFEKIGPDNVAQHAEKLEMAVRKLRSHAMPPPKEPRPDEAQLAVVRVVARGRAR